MNSFTPEAPKLFTKDDILELLQDEGLNEDNCFIEPQGYNLISEIAQNFVEEILDTYKHKKKELLPSDIKRAISLKFPDVYMGESIDNKIIMQNKANALDEIDERVRDIEKKFNNQWSTCAVIFIVTISVC